MGLSSRVPRGLLVNGGQRFQRWGMAYMRVVGSLRITAILWTAVIVALIWGKLLVNHYGKDYAQWHHFGSYWFVALLMLTAVNMFCVLVRRLAIRKHYAGFQIAHLGLILWLSGLAYSFFGSFAGTINLSNGESATRLMLSDSHEIRAQWPDRPQERPYLFTFQPESIDWLKREPFVVGTVDGVTLNVLRFVRQAAPVVDWVADANHRGGPALKLKISGASQVGATEKFLPDEQFGDETFVGPIHIQLQQAGSARALEEFLNPPTDLDGSGQLVAVYQDHLERIDVDSNLGKRITIGDSNVACEISEYLPDARPDALGRFSSRSQEPKNPLLELKVYFANETQPRRQIVFAKSPLTNLDGVYGSLPVKFRYYHPQATPPMGVELLQAENKTLYARVIADGKFDVRGEINEDSQIGLSGGFQLSILEYWPHAVRNIRFEHCYSPADGQQAGPAALVEIKAAGVQEKVWLQRNDPLYGLRIIDTPQGPLTLRYANKTTPLGFRVVRSDDVRQDEQQPPVENAVVVRLLDDAKGIDVQRKITRDQPLVHAGFRLTLPADQDSSQLLAPPALCVKYVPGRWLQWSGMMAVGGGAALMLVSAGLGARKTRVAA